MARSQASRARAALNSRERHSGATGEVPTERKCQFPETPYITRSARGHKDRSGREAVLYCTKLESTIRIAVDLPDGKLLPAASCSAVRPPVTGPARRLLCDSGLAHETTMELSWTTGRLARQDCIKVAHSDASCSKITDKCESVRELKVADGKCVSLKIRRNRTSSLGPDGARRKTGDTGARSCNTQARVEAGGVGQVGEQGARRDRPGARDWRDGEEVPVRCWVPLALSSVSRDAGEWVLIGIEAQIGIGGRKAQAVRAG